ncbi:hypothetical protein OK016_00445 [Vibrio chagasii]|nr:hypothetical protein [Vibrio chagasii]
MKSLRRVDLTLESYLPMDTRWKLSGTAGQYLGRYEHRDGSNPTKTCCVSS